MRRESGKSRESQIEFLNSYVTAGQPSVKIECGFYLSLRLRGQAEAGSNLIDSQNNLR